MGPTASDISGWERRLAAETMEYAADVMADCAIDGPVDEFRHLAHVWAVLSARPVYIVGRDLIISSNPGMMPSGTYMTSFVNGICRMLLAFAAGAESAMVLGDDCLEWHANPNKAFNDYNEWGLVTREVVTYPAHGLQFSFCSKYYDATVGESDPLVVPQSWAKMLATYANLKVRTPSHLAALGAELCGLPATLHDEIMRWASQCPMTLPVGVEKI